MKFSAKKHAILLTPHKRSVMWGMRQSTLLLRAVGTPHWSICSVPSARRQSLSLSSPHNKLCGVNRISCLWHDSLLYLLIEGYRLTIDGNIAGIGQTNHTQLFWNILEPQLRLSLVTSWNNLYINIFTFFQMILISLKIDRVNPHGQFRVTKVKRHSIRIIDGHFQHHSIRLYPLIFHQHLYPVGTLEMLKLATIVVVIFHLIVVRAEILQYRHHLLALQVLVQLQNIVLGLAVIQRAQRHPILPRVIAIKRRLLEGVVKNHRRVPRLLMNGVHGRLVVTETRDIGHKRRAKPYADEQYKNRHRQDKSQYPFLPQFFTCISEQQEQHRDRNGDGPMRLGMTVDGHHPEKQDNQLSY